MLLSGGTRSGPMGTRGGATCNNAIACQNLFKMCKVYFRISLLIITNNNGPIQKQTNKKKL